MRKKTIFVLLLLIGVVFNAFSAPPRVTNVVCVSRGLTTPRLTFAWTTPANNLTNMEVRISANPINTLNWGNATLVEGVNNPGSAGTRITATITSAGAGGLLTNTAYYLGVRVQDNTGAWSMVSLVGTGVTFGKPTCTLHCNWNPSTDPLVNSYVLYVGTNYLGTSYVPGIENQTYLRLVLPNVTTNAVVLSLTNGYSSYFCYVTAAIDGLAESDPSNVLPIDMNGDLSP